MSWVATTAAESVIEGAKLALQANDAITELFLVGRREEIQAALTTRRFRDHRVRVVHASEVLKMDDKPVAGLRRKKDCSIVRAVDFVKEGRPTP